MSKNIEKVKELEKKHQLVSENLIDSIWTIDVETLTFEYITDSIEKMSGYSPLEYINHPLEEKVTPESFTKIKEVLAQQIPKFKKGIKDPVSVELELVHKSRKRYWAEIRARLFQEPGEKLKVIGVTRDITARKNEEHQKNRLIEKLGKALAEKEALLQENKVLKRLLPICSGCKRIRDDKGHWLPLDLYVQKETQSRFSHTICKDCQEAYYGEEAWYQKKKKRDQGDS